MEDLLSATSQTSEDNFWVDLAGLHDRFQGWCKEEEGLFQVAVFGLVNLTRSYNMDDEWDLIIEVNEKQN